MGAGNFLPVAHHEHRPYQMVYINLDKTFGFPEGEDDSSLMDSLVQDALAQLGEDLIAFLPGSFYFYPKDQTRWRGRNEVVIADNAFVEVTMGDGGSGRIPLTLAVRDDIDERRRGIAERALHQTATRAFDSLAFINYSMAVWYGPHTSGPYTPTKEQTDAKDKANAKTP